MASNSASTSNQKQNRQTYEKNIELKITLCGLGSKSHKLVSLYGRIVIINFEIQTTSGYNQKMKNRLEIVNILTNLISKMKAIIVPKVSN